DLKELLKDEHGAAESQEGEGEGRPGETQRKRSRNCSKGEGENRWDRIRAKFRALVMKTRLDAHLLQVYEQDGWRSMGREKLKPQAELQKAHARLRAIKLELRAATRRLAEMNPGGPRWRELEEDQDGLIDVENVACTTCGKTESDANNDILLCDHQGCFR
ncbi:unnamed protein product, partial [Discosporangium mesarthrocarpum]